MPDKTVRVKVAGCGVNFADILQCQGKYQEKRNTPFVPGFECVGEVVEIGPSSKGVSVGDKVICLSQGGVYSQYVTAHDSTLIPLPLLPANINLADAAALLVTYGTAYLALTNRGRIQAGDNVLVTAAAGGVGLAAVELASKVFGANVFAAAGSDEKLQIAVSKGANPRGVINYSGLDAKMFKEQVAQAVMNVMSESTQSKDVKKGVDIMVDMVGGDFLEAG